MTVVFTPPGDVDLLCARACTLFSILNEYEGPAVFLDQCFGPDVPDPQAQHMGQAVVQRLLQRTGGLLNGFAAVYEHRYGKSGGWRVLAVEDRYRCKKLWKCGIAPITTAVMRGDASTQRSACLHQKTNMLLCTPLSITSLAFREAGVAGFSSHMSHPACFCCYRSFFCNPVSAR